jgi:DNA-binding transcriptional ArsR family regulator
VTANGRALSALADPTRRAIFEQLRGGPRSVGELASTLPVSRPAVSQHLRVLKEAGLVGDRPNGTKRLYRIVPQGVAELRDYVEDIWSRALADFKEAVEEDYSEENRSTGNVSEEGGTE